MTMVSGPTPVAPAGTLAATPLAHVLVSLRNERLSGALELRVPSGRQAHIDLDRGAATFAMTAPSVARFGAVAYELGLIDAARLDAVCVESNEKQTPEADLLVAAGSITMAQRDQAAREQIRRRILHAFTFPPETQFTFVEAKPAVNPPELVVDMLASIWRGVLAFPPGHEGELVLGRVGDAALRLVSESALEQADFDPRARAIVEALAQRPMSVTDLVRSHPLPHDRTRLLAYFLLIANCLEPHTAQLSGLKIRAATARTSSSSMGAVIVTPEALGIEGIRHRAATLTLETPYQALGLPEGASIEAARAAYYRLARVWHPDRLPSHLEIVFEETTKIFLHMTDAYRSIASVEVARG